MRPVVGTVAILGGMDPSGGAGLLRDTWAVERRRAPLEVRAVATALTRQGDGQRARVEATEPDRLRDELDRLLDVEPLLAVKIGLVPEAAVDPVARFLSAVRARPEPPPIVLDPILVASDGGSIGAPTSALVELAHRVDLLTPNVAELGQLAASADGEDNLDRVRALGLPSTAVLIKGERFLAGFDGRTPWIRDRLVGPDGVAQVVERPAVDGPDPRGTGCALASAIAGELALGRSLPTAVVAGIAWLDGARRRVRPGPDGRAHLS